MNEQVDTRTFSVGVDAGEVFTHSAVICDGGETYVGRAPTDPDPSIGFFGAIAEAAEAMDLTLQGLMSRTGRLVHATTVGMSVLAAGAEPEIALLTTEGHGDTAGAITYRGSWVYEPGDEWQFPADRPAPFLDRANVFEIRERVDVAGDVLIPLDRASVVRAAHEICRRGITSVAISLLWAHVNPTHEQRVRDILKEECLRQGLEPFVTCGHEVSPSSGETRRAAMTVANACIAPALHRDVSRILERARVAGYVGELLFASGDGGLIDARTVMEFPIRTLQGGARAGVAACRPPGREAGSRSLLFTDLGGTRFDVGVMGEGPRSVDDPVEARPDGGHGELVESSRLGGGTVAWIDESGRLRVGPVSAGAWPGPACFRRGGSAPTLTDADLVLGVLNPDPSLPDGRPVDEVAADQAIRSVAEPLGMTVLECAAGIVEIADSIAESVLRRASFGREGELRDLDLWATGGAAGMHAGSYAFGLGIRRLIIPMGEMASDWGAYALATAQEAVDFSDPLSEEYPFDTARLESARREAAERATSRTAIPDTERLVFWRELGGMVSTPVFKSRSVRVGDQIPGPALVDCSRSTVLIRPRQLLTVDAFGNFVVTRTVVGDGDE